MTSAARIVIAESIKYAIPNGLEFFNQQRFCQRNPNIVHDKKTAGRVGHLTLELHQQSVS